MSLSKQDFRPTSRPLAWALGLAFTASPALAQESPWYIGASLGFRNDSNVFRTLTDEKSETSTSAGVLGGLDSRSICPERMDPGDRGDRGRRSGAPSFQRVVMRLQPDIVLALLRAGLDAAPLAVMVGIVTPAATHGKPPELLGLLAVTHGHACDAQ